MAKEFRTVVACGSRGGQGLTGMGLRGYFGGYAGNLYCDGVWVIQICAIAKTHWTVYVRFVISL